MMRSLEGMMSPFAAPYLQPYPKDILTTTEMGGRLFLTKLFEQAEPGLHAYAFTSEDLREIHTAIREDYLRIIHELQWDPRFTIKPDESPEEGGQRIFKEYLNVYNTRTSHLDTFMHAVYGQPMLTPVFTASAAYWSYGWLRLEDHVRMPRPLEGFLRQITLLTEALKEPTFREAVLTGSARLPRMFQTVLAWTQFKREDVILTFLPEAWIAYGTVALATREREEKIYLPPPHPRLEPAGQQADPP